MKQTTVIHSDPDILGGTPVFKGTRVPVEALFDYLRQSTVEEFLRGYPQVSRQMVDAVLEQAAETILKTKRRNTHEGPARRAN